MICIVNADIYTPLDHIQPGCIVIDEGHITAVDFMSNLPPPPGASILDAGGRTVAPGFIDLHFYACGGHTLEDVESIPQNLAAIAGLLPRWGVTAFLISVPMADRPTLARTLAATVAAGESRPAGARLLGIHLEGPFLNPGRRGAFQVSLLRPPSLDEARDYVAAARGRIRVVTMAPELPNAQAVGRLFRDAGAVPSLGHSVAGYEEARSALADFPLVTHMFNAMTGLHHREPGVVGAVLDSTTATAMLICDGIHVHPAAVRLMLRLLGPDRVILVTDAMAGAGLGDGVYRVEGQVVTVSQGWATLPDGTLAGSVLTMDRAVDNVQRFAELALPDALKMATVNPARALGLEHERGALAPGRNADIVVLDGSGRPWTTIVGGEIVWQA